MAQSEIYILGIESSCDDTSAAVSLNTQILSNVISTQKIHEIYGGVVPELASRAHMQNIVPVINEAINKAGITLDKIDAIAFTRGPGLLGSLLVGTSFAKSLSMALGKPLIEFKAGQKKAIVDQFERLAGETGAEFADPANSRQIGTIVDKAMVNAFDVKKSKVDQAYQLARDSGETKQVVDTTKLDQYLTFVQPEAIAVPEINSIKAKLEVLKTAKNGQVTIDDLENLYKVAGQLGKKGDPSGVFMSDIKKIINEVTEGTGGDLYRAARAQRNQLGKEFEDTYRVAKLLGTKGGYADRAVALDDVFKHVVLDGSLEEMRTVTKILKKAGPEGQQAYKELQGQTIEHLKDQLTKNASGELSFAKLKTSIEQLDREGKLQYMYGKAGRDKLMDLKATVQDALVKDPRAVNWSNTGNVVLRGLDALSAVRFPGAQTAAEIAQNIALKKKVAESINFNALAPSKASTNKLAQ